MATGKMSDDEVLQKLDQTTVYASLHQLQTLATILHRNGGVRYLQPFLRRGLRNRSSEDSATEPIDFEDFRRLVPFSTYEDYEDHINRMAEGSVDEEDDDDCGHLLSVDSLVCFFYSSGTSSMKPKLIPYFDSEPSKFISYLAHQSSGATHRRLFPPRSSVNKVLWFIYAGNVTVTKGGFKAMAATAFPLNNNNKMSQSLFLSSIVAPAEVIMGSNLHQQMYCHMLCGLRKSELVDGIRAPYAVGLVRAFSLLESSWKQLCDDLEEGTLNAQITDAKMRDSVSELLGGPQPEIAHRVRSICEDKDWHGILSKLWPEARYVKCVATGSMQQYYGKLKYFAGDMPLLGGDYFASECCIGINLDIMQPPELTRYVMLPTAAYYEFLPFSLDDNSVSLMDSVDFSGLEVGKCYEVVVTTYRGLYRYRIGDIIRVVGFHHSSPEVEFVTRAPKSSSEILTERDLMRAVENLQFALGKLMGEIIEFSCFMDSESSKKLKIYVEVKDGCRLLQTEKSDELVGILRSCCSSIEEGLGYIYKARREKGEIGPFTLSVVQPGTFDKLLQAAIENDAPASQYKPPKIIRNSKLADFMDRNAILTVCLGSSSC